VHYAMSDSGSDLGLKRSSRDLFAKFQKTRGLKMNAAQEKEVVESLREIARQLKLITAYFKTIPPKKSSNKIAAEPGPK
jgi:hypothetical protein